MTAIRVGCLALFALILALAFCPQATLAFGISPLRSSAPFVPGGEVSGSFTVVNPEGFENVHVSAESDIGVVFNERIVRLAGNDGVVDFQVELPQGRLSPGDHEVKIFVEPVITANTTGMIARARLAHKLVVRVPYEGPYVIVSVEVERTAKGEVVLQADLENKGDTATPIHALFIMTPQGRAQQLLNASFGPVTLDAGEKARVNVTFPSTRIPSGDYTIDLIVRYDGRVINTSAVYRKGEPRFSLTQTPAFVKAEDINAFPIGVHSEWNQPIEGLYAEIVLMEGKDALRLFRTESVDVPAFGDAVLSGIFDARGIAPRNATILVRLHFSATQEFNVPVEMVNAHDYEWRMAELELAKNASAASAAPAEAQLFWLVGLLLLAVIIIAVIIARRVMRGDVQ